MVVFPFFLNVPDLFGVGTNDDIFGTNKNKRRMLMPNAIECPGPVQNSKVGCQGNAPKNILTGKLFIKVKNVSMSPGNTIIHIFM